MVQQDEQYRFCYAVAFDMMTDLLREKRGRAAGLAAPKPHLTLPASSSPSFALQPRTATPDPDILRAEEAHSNTSSSHSENPSTSEEEGGEGGDGEERGGRANHGKEGESEGEGEEDGEDRERELAEGYGRAKRLGQVDSLRLERRQTEG